MATSYEYAAMSNNAYGDTKVSLGNDWEIYREFSLKDNDDGYSGVAYINRNTKEVAFAHRVTHQPFWDDAGDNAAIGLGNIPDQFAVSETFVDQVDERLAADGLGGYFRRHTGHSLGAVIAQLHAAKAHSRGNFHIRTEVFESPGVTVEMFRKVAGEEFDPRGMKITNYVSSPNFINTTNSHFADLVRIDVEQKVSSSTSRFLPWAYKEYVSNQPKMLNIANAFDPATGKARNGRPVEEWPTSGYDHFMSYKNNRPYWDAYFAAKNLSITERSRIVKSYLGDGPSRPTLPGYGRSRFLRPPGETGNVDRGKGIGKDGNEGAAVTDLPEDSGDVVDGGTDGTTPPGGSGGLTGPGGGAPATPARWRASSLPPVGDTGPSSATATPKASPGPGAGGLSREIIDLILSGGRSRGAPRGIGSLVKGSPGTLAMPDILGLTDEDKKYILAGRKPPIKPKAVAGTTLLSGCKSPSSKPNGYGNGVTIPHPRSPGGLADELSLVGHPGPKSYTVRGNTLLSGAMSPPSRPPRSGYGATIPKSLPGRWGPRNA